MTPGERSRKSKLDDLFKHSESDLEPLHIRVKDDQLEIVEEISEDHGVSKAEVVRRLLDRGLNSLLK